MLLRAVLAIFCLMHLGLLEAMGGCCDKQEPRIVPSTSSAVVAPKPQRMAAMQQAQEGYNGEIELVQLGYQRPSHRFSPSDSESHIDPSMLVHPQQEEGGMPIHIIDEIRPAHQQGYPFFSPTVTTQATSSPLMSPLGSTNRSFELSLDGSSGQNAAEQAGAPVYIIDERGLVGQAGHSFLSPSVTTQATPSPMMSPLGSTERSFELSFGGSSERSEVVAIEQKPHAEKKFFTIISIAALQHMNIAKGTPDGHAQNYIRDYSITRYKKERKDIETEIARLEQLIETQKFPLQSRVRQLHEKIAGLDRIHLECDEDGNIARYGFFQQGKLSRPVPLSEKEKSKHVLPILENARLGIEREELAWEEWRWEPGRWEGSVWIQGERVRDTRRAKDAKTNFESRLAATAHQRRIWDEPARMPTPTRELERTASHPLLSKKGNKALLPTDLKENKMTLSLSQEAIRRQDIEDEKDTPRESALTRKTAKAIRRRSEEDFGSKSILAIQKNGKGDDKKHHA